MDRLPCVRQYLMRERAAYAARSLSRKGPNYEDVRRSCTHSFFGFFYRREVRTGQVQIEAEVQESA